MEKIYNKLVRDKIPEIIENDGETPIVRVLNDNEYKKELEKKLKEEDEDIQSVINIMDKKREKRGGFTKKLFLEKTIK